MQHTQTNRTTHDKLRIVFNDRVVFLPLGDRATIGDVAQSLRDFVPRGYGNPIAIDVMLDVSSNQPGPSHVTPVGFKYEEDRAAVFDCTLSPEAIFMAPHQVTYGNA
jgi:hypothetical protein